MQQLTALFTTPSFVFDSICAVALVAVALYQGRRGFVATVVGLVGNLAAILGAKFASDWAAPQIFDRLMAQRFQRSIAETLAETGSMDLSALTGQLGGFLPESLRQSILDQFGQTITQAVGAEAETLAATIVTDVVQPLMTPVLAIVVFFVVFALCRMVVSILVNLLVGVNNLPLLGVVNRTLGIVVGFVYAAILLFLGLCIVWTVMVVTGGSLPWLNDAVLANSVFYRLFNQLNPFVV